LLLKVLGEMIIGEFENICAELCGSFLYDVQSVPWKVYQTAGCYFVSSSSSGGGGGS